jgi:alpha-tubulin suppressor-like RCC1 family protein
MEELRDHRVSRVVAGKYHCAALTEDGALFTWETARDTQTATSEPLPELGYGRFIHDIGVPYRVFAFEGVRIASVAVGNGHTVAVAEAGAVYSFGIADGTLAHGDGEDWEDVFIPKRVEVLYGIHMVSVAAGSYHSRGSIHMGDFEESSGRDRGPVPELGYGSLVQDVGVPHRVFALVGMRITSVAVGTGFTVAVTEAGAVYSFGLDDGRLGHGGSDEEEGVFLPKRIEALDGVHVASVAAGNKHTPALTRCGRVYSWGWSGLNSPVYGHR